MGVVRDIRRWGPCAEHGARLLDERGFFTRFGQSWRVSAVTCWAPIGADGDGGSCR